MVARRYHRGAVCKYQHIDNKQENTLDFFGREPPFRYAVTKSAQVFA
jgi:hypothetical protein